MGAVVRACGVWIWAWAWVVVGCGAPPGEVEGGGGRAEQTGARRQAMNAPVANDDANMVLQGESVSVEAPGLLANDSDPDGGPTWVHVPEVYPSGLPLDGPRGLAFNSAGELYVVDTNNGRLVLLNQQNELIREVGAIFLDEPYSVDVGRDDKFYVVDVTGIVYGFYPNGALIQRIGNTDNIPQDNFTRPLGVALDSQGNIYVADTFNRRIQVFRPNASFLRGWNRINSNPLGLTGRVSLDSADNVYVSDLSSDSVHVFTSTGGYIRTIGSSGTGDGQLDFPRDVAFDADNNVYVADANNNRVQVFGADGTFLRKIVPAGSSLNSPSGVAFNAEGDLYVSDTENDRLVIFPSSQLITTSKGSARVWSDGSYTYTANPEATGTDTFSYQILDPGGLLSNTATVTIQINAAPVAVADAYTTDEDAPLVVEALGVLGNDADVDGDRIEAALVEQPTHGVLSLGLDGSFRYTPEQDFYGADAFTYQARDDKGAMSEVVVVNLTVVPVNDAPVAQGASLSLPEDAEPVFLMPQASDTEGDALGYTITQAPTKGTLSGEAPDLTYAPNPDATGTDSFAFVVNDGSADSNEATITIELVPINDAPVAQAQAVSLVQDGSASVTLGGLDVDGDALTLEVTVQPQRGQLVCEGALCVYTPEAGFVGQDEFAFTAYDGALTSEPAVVTLTVEPSDEDGDLVFDDDDNCPQVSNADQANLDADGLGDACDDDDDNDGVIDEADNCPAVENPDQLDAEEDLLGDACDEDDDNDGAGDGEDSCPMVSNADQADANDDGTGDACDDDDDGDGVADGDDLCPLIPDPAQDDLDGDAQGDACDPDDDNDRLEDGDDNCALLSNEDQLDTDADGAGDACDPDDDADGVEDSGDNCPLEANPEQSDEDGDGLGAACDDADQPAKPDTDADGVPDDEDNCRDAANADQADADQDGVGDVCDEPDDGDNSGDNSGDDGEEQIEVSTPSDDGCGCSQPAAPVGRGWAVVGSLVGLVGLGLLRRRRASERAV